MTSLPQPPRPASRLGSWPGDGEGAREGAAASQLSAASANASPEGVELLRADVKWLWSKLGQAGGFKIPLDPPEKKDNI